MIKAICVYMNRIVDSQDNVIIDLDNYVVGHATAVYTASDVLYCDLDFKKNINEIIISLSGNSGTPRSQINILFAEFPYNGNPKRARVFIKGGGFVPGHVIQVNFLAKLKD